MARRTVLEQLLTLSQVREILGIKSRQTIYTKVKAGQIPPPVRIGKTPRWRESDIRAFIDGLAA